MSRNHLTRTARIIGLVLVVSAIVVPAAQAMPSRTEMAKVKNGVVVASSPQAIIAGRPLPNPDHKVVVRAPGRDLSAEIAAGGIVTGSGEGAAVAPKPVPSSGGTDVDWTKAGLAAATTVAGMALLGVGILMSRRHRLSFR
jgi:hypothetical protein